MAEKHLISHDPDFGVTQYYSFDSLTGETTLETQWTSEVDEANKVLYNEHSDYKPNLWKGDMHWVGQIPPVIVVELQKKGIWFDDKALLKWLNDPDQEVFRTKPGSLIHRPGQGK